MKSLLRGTSRDERNSSDNNRLLIGKKAEREIDVAPNAVVAISTVMTRDLSVGGITVGAQQEAEMEDNYVHSPV